MLCIGYSYYWGMAIIQDIISWYTVFPINFVYYLYNCFNLDYHKYNTNFFY